MVSVNKRITFIAKRERRHAERKWRKTKLTILKDMYRPANHKVSKIVHTAKGQFSTEWIALASTCKDLHQVVKSLSNTHQPKYCHPFTLVLTFSIFHQTHHKQTRELWAYIASDHVSQHLPIGQLLQIYLHLKQFHNQQRKNAFFILLVCHVT